jgi:hypothetical protein
MGVAVISPGLLIELATEVHCFDRPSFLPAPRPYVRLPFPAGFPLGTHSGSKPRAFLERGGRTALRGPSRAEDKDDLRVSASTLSSDSNSLRNVASRDDMGRSNRLQREVVQGWLSMAIIYA